ncbi:MAG: GAF domain-containing protein [Nitrospinae bacterium]|nr:GAF domain-containing protein [Nitrospinota bacterium]
MALDARKRRRFDSYGDEPENHEVTLARRLIEIGISLSSERNLDNLLQKIVDSAIEITNADGCTLYLTKNMQLHFTVSRNVSLGIAIGGTTGATATFPPVPMAPTFVSAYAAITRKTVNIPDVYQSDEFDFTGPKKYDERTGYRSVSMLVTPLLDYQSDVIGVLQILNAKDHETGDVIPFDNKYVGLAKSLASQAAVAISNVNLIRETEMLFESFVEVMATATDARSKYTHGHIRRVAELALELARAINEESDGKPGGAAFSDDELNELRIAAWMHDIGKIVSPTHIMDKSVKLETIFDRSELVRTRYELIISKARAECAVKKAGLCEKGAGREEVDALEKEYENKLAALVEERNFVISCNNPGEFMEDAKIERLKKIAAGTYELDGKTFPKLTEDELFNLSIRKGSLTEDERKIMQSHIDVTIRMLDKIPFSRKLRNVPLYAGSHHEYLDGSGYPKGLKADSMSTQARILALVDFFEALTASDRPYKRQMPMSTVYSILQTEVDKGRLDAELFRILKEKDVYSRFLARIKDKKTAL